MARVGRGRGRSGGRGRGRRICPPRLYTSTVKPPGELRIAIGRSKPAVYRLDGWLEIELTERGRSAVATVRTINLRARPRGKRRGGTLPNQIFIGAALGTRASCRLSLETGKGQLEVPVAIRHEAMKPVLITDGPRGSTRTRGPASIPAVLTLDIEYDLRSGGFAISGAGRVLASSPGLPLNAALTMICTCICDPTKYCLEMCVSVKVCVVNGQPIVDAGLLDALFTMVNHVWGCKPGKCCIHFKHHIIPVPLPTSVSSADLAGLFKTRRSYECYNLYIVPDVVGRAGATHVGGTTPGSVVETANGVPNLWSAIAHELGHALGLANEEGGDPDGVEEHSNEPDNLMGPRLPVGSKLTPAQCEQARSSPLLKPTKQVCPE